MSSFFAHLSPAELETAYDARGAVPEHPSLMADWERRGDALLACRPARMDLAYGSGAREYLDLFPADEPGAPLLVYLHGGYWQRGDKSLYRFVAEGPLDRGLAVALIGYPLCPAVRIGTIVEAVRRAVGWLWREAPKLGFDRERIALCGHSAGGHLCATTLAAGGAPTRAEATRAPRLRGGLAISGLYELEPLRHTSIDDALHLGTDEARAASPMGMHPPPGTRLLAVYGGEESQQFRLQAEALRDAWGAHGTEVTVHGLPGANHFTILEHLAQRDGTLCERVVNMLSG